MYLVCQPDTGSRGNKERTIKLAKTLALAAIMAGASALSGFAGTGSQGHFQIYNDTANNIVVGFYTNDGSGWSTNWLSSKISPGESATAQFDADTGNCAQHFSVGWQGENGGEVIDEPISIDICDASNVYLGDNEISYD